MRTEPPAPAPADAPSAAAASSPSSPLDDEARSVPASGHAAADTLADAADETGTVRATRRMPEPDSLGG